eukprot:TRINITY_DN1839_c0_g2_i3.p1 TRINITY_DN1839_c0_g2~~TRINITY_DN1839_c0_g2_i3.p1  ORF type:complete len:341 (-),score=92.15 TRINITY_DN1839_c0_g2_i3:263-1285(-)
MQKWSSKGCTLQGVSNGKVQCSCTVISDYAARQLNAPSRSSRVGGGSGNLTLTNSTETGNGNGVGPAAGLTVLVGGTVFYFFYFVKQFKPFPDLPNMYTIHPVYSIWKVNHEASPRLVRLLLYAATIAIQAFIAAVYLKFGVKTPPDVDYGQAGPALGAALVVSFPANYCFAWVARHYIPKDKLPSIDQVMLRLFYKIMIIGIAVCFLGAIGICAIMTTQGGNVFIAAAIGAIVVDMILDAACVYLSQKMPQVFNVCKMRGFYVEDIPKMLEAKPGKGVRGTKKKRSIVKDNDEHKTPLPNPMSPSSHRLNDGGGTPSNRVQLDFLRHKLSVQDIHLNNL